MPDDLTPFKFSIGPMREIDFAKVRKLETLNAARPQVQVRIDHDFHAGVYARTAYIPKDTLITGALIKIPTLLIVEGDTMIYVGEDEPLHATGYNVIRAAAGRKQAFVAISDVKLTMIFATSAKTVEEAEAEFTDELGLLTTRREIA